jgi:hypothetical protein
MTFGFALLLMLVVGCNERTQPLDADPGISRTAIGTETRGPGASQATPDAVGSGGCPLTADVCALADTVRSMLEGHEVGRLIDQAMAQQFECLGPNPVGLGGPYPLCDGSIPGERRSGYPIGFLGSEGGVLSVDQYREFLTDWLANVSPSSSDDKGPGTVRLLTIGCPLSAVSAGQPCETDARLVFSSIQDRGYVTGPTRSILALTARRSSPTAPFVVVQTLVGLAVAAPPAMLSGGEAEGYQYFLWS